MKIKKDNLKKIVLWSVYAYFLLIIFLPAVFILGGVFQGKMSFNWQIVHAVGLSFFVSLTVVLIDLLFGLPLAWILTRSKSRLATVVDSLIDLSLVVPTAALGFGIYLYWGSEFGLGRLFGLENGIFNKGVVMIILLHTVFTLPYMLRSVGAAIAQIKPSYEEAATTLGAWPFTLFRTVSLPLFRDGVINGSILAFTRSLSETGATMMVAGAVATAPVLVVGLKKSGQLPEAMAVSIVLIISAVLILLIAKKGLGQKVVNLEKVYPRWEKAAAKLVLPRNFILGMFFLFVLFLPTVFIVFYDFHNFQPVFNAAVVNSLAVSFFVAFAITALNLVFALPLAYLIARGRGRLVKTLDSLNEVVLVVPTSALGLSLVLFWHNFLSEEYLILLLAHLSFSFPLMLKPLIASFRDIPPSLEEASFAFGADSWQMFKSVLLPLIKPAVIAGAIMAFMRSLSETGATLAVSDKIKTAPILIVNLVEKGELGQAAFIATVLFVVAVFFLLLLKITYRQNSY